MVIVTVVLVLVVLLVNNILVNGPGTDDEMHGDTYI